MKDTVIGLSVAGYVIFVPSGAYYLLADPRSGYPTQFGGLVVLVLAVIGTALVVFVERARQAPSDPDSPSDSAAESVKER